MKEMIRSWYNGEQNYLIGVSIYANSDTHDDHLLSLFRKGPTPFTIAKLVEELLLIYQSDEIDNEEKAAPYTEYAPKTSDPVLEELYLYKVDLHKKKDFLRHNLSKIASDVERGAAAHEILRLRDEISKVWQQEAYYKEHHRLPEIIAGVTDPSMMKHRRTQVSVNIRRLRMLLKRNPNNSSYQSSMAKFEAELSELKKRIKVFKKRTNGQTAR